MKYCKILITLNIWHLKPYKVIKILQGYSYTEYGFLCLKLILTHE